MAFVAFSATLVAIWVALTQSAKEQGIMAITDWPQDERPREKLIKHGPQHLSDAEL